MQAQTICKKQQKNTLSAKKKKKQTIKTVLASPYETYWPLISEEDRNHLVQTLKECLPRIRPIVPKIPYKDIKNVPKNERKEFRQNYNNQTGLRTDKERNECSSLIFGVNSVTIAIENRQIGSILIANEVQPRNLVQHVIDMAVYNKIPILIVREFKEIINECCGITTAVFGIKNNLQNNLKTNLIHQLICNIYEHYPVSSGHILFKKVQNNPSKHQHKNSEVNNSDSKVDVKSLHLHRDTDEIRIFMPEESMGVAKNSQDFLEFSDNHNSKNNKIPVIASYRSMIVKRLKGDKNRNLRKIEKFKKKKTKN